MAVGKRPISQRVKHLLSIAADKASDQLRGDSARKLLRDGTLTMGRHTYGLPQVHYYPGDTEHIEIGQFVSIAEGVEMIPNGNHRVDYVSTFPHPDHWGIPNPDKANPARTGIKVGNDVWLGRGTRIVGSVSIGSGAVIGAYSLVAHDVPAYAIAVGHPAEVKRYRFSDQQISDLLSIAWWDWGDDTIRSRAQDIMSPNIDGFIAKYRITPG